VAEVNCVYDPSSGIDIEPNVFHAEKYALLAQCLRDEPKVGDEDVGRVYTPSYVEDVPLARMSPAAPSPLSPRKATSKPLPQ